MRSLLLTIAIIFFITFNVTAQGQFDPTPAHREQDDDVKNKPFKERLIFGGGLGAQFGTNTYVNLSPIIGYRVTDKLSTGIGITYIYYKYQYYYGTQTYYDEDNIYGGNVWGEYRIIPQAFIHVEPGFLNLSVPNASYTEYVRDNVYTFLVGGGYFQEIGSNAGVQLSLLWDLVEDKYSPYQNPIIRIGFVAGF